MFKCHSKALWVCGCLQMLQWRIFQAKVVLKPFQLNSLLHRMSLDVIFMNGMKAGHLLNTRGEEERGGLCTYCCTFSYIQKPFGICLLQRSGRIAEMPWWQRRHLNFCGWCPHTCQAVKITRVRKKRCPPSPATVRTAPSFCCLPLKGHCLLYSQSLADQKGCRIQARTPREKLNLLSAYGSPQIIWGVQLWGSSPPSWPCQCWCPSCSCTARIGRGKSEPTTNFWWGSWDSFPPSFSSISFL